MSQIEKLISRMQSIPVPKDIHFYELKKYLEYFGFKLDRTKGSHNVFTHSMLLDEIVVPTKNGKAIKPIYIVEINRIIKQLEEM